MIMTIVIFDGRMSHNDINNNHYNTRCTYNNTRDGNHTYGNYIGNNTANNASPHLPIYCTIVLVLFKIPYINHNMQHYVRRHEKEE